MAHLWELLCQGQSATVFVIPSNRCEHRCLEIQHNCLDCLRRCKKYNCQSLKPGRSTDSCLTNVALGTRFQMSLMILNKRIPGRKSKIVSWTIAELTQKASSKYAKQVISLETNEISKRKRFPLDENEVETFWFHPQIEDSMPIHL